MSETLEQLKEQINQAHGLHARIITEGIEQARLLGQMLAKAKSLVPYGSWCKWVSDNLSFSGDSARLYIRVFKEWDRICAATPEPGALNYLRARETLGNKKPYRPVNSEARNPDWLKATAEASDGDLVDMLVEILSRRADPERIIRSIQQQLPKAKRNASYGEMWRTKHPSKEMVGA